MSGQKVVSTVVMIKDGKRSEPASAFDDQDDVIDEPPKEKKRMDLSTTRAGGAYIPPAKLRAMQEKVTDKNSEQYQRISWELLKKHIHGQVNRVNVENVQKVVLALINENIVRGKGLLARSIIQAQAFSPTFSHVYACLVAIINSKFPKIGELILKRLILQFKRAFKNNDKAVAITASKFIAHLINQNVAHEILALEIMTLLLSHASEDAVEVAIAFLKECGQKLAELTPRGLDAIYGQLRSILHDSDIDKRVQYAIEVAFHVRKDKFSAYPSVMKELDLVEEEDQITHEITLDDPMDPENLLNVFRFDPEFEKNQQMYQEIKSELLDSDSSDDEEGEEGEEGGDEEGEQPAAAAQETTILDNTETNLVAFRRTVYLTIQSSLDYQEAIHKLMKTEIKPGMEVELCHMILDCCAQQRTYEKFYGLMAERFCRIKKEFQTHFEQFFKDTYDTIHRFEITKLRNTTRLFAHLLYTDAISWDVLGHIKLNEDDTTSPGRIFIKILFQELAEFMGLESLFKRIRDPTMQHAFDGILPRNNPRDTRFAINFFVSIGLGGLTVDLREHLKSGPKQQEVVALPEIPSGNVKQEPDDAVLRLANSRSSSDSETDSSSSSEDARRERERKRKRKHHKKERKSNKKEKTKERREKTSSTSKRRR